MQPDNSASAKSAGLSARFWYLAGMCPYFCAIGIQNVVFIWLYTQVLHESPARVGLAQMLTMLPMLTIVLLGGAMADRRELRRYLIILQVIAALLPLCLGGMIWTGRLTYWGLVAISVSIGVLGAFIVPARDAMLSVVDDGEIQRTVTAMTGLQFSSQIAGLTLGGAASWLAASLGEGRSDPVGAIVLVMMQAGFVFLSAAMSSKLPIAAPQPRPGRPGAIAGIIEGFAAVWASDAIRPVSILMFCIGTLFTGVFLVQIPIMVRDVYHGSSITLAALNIAFMGGTTCAVLILRRRRPVANQGRAMLLSGAASAVIIGMIALAPPLPVMALLAAAWGASGGVSMIMSRTLVQTAAPAAVRGRILSIFQLCFVGGAPLGCYAMGLIIHETGAVLAALVPAIGMALLVAAAWRLSAIGQLRR